MASITLPILTLAVRQQRYSCHGCGNCCRDFTVQLREQDLAKLHEQGWESRLGEPVTVEFRGTTYLRQREDGACIFLMDDGLCRIHKEFGFQAKPVACQLFPFHVTPTARGLSMGLSFACQSVLENKGAELKSHAAELGRMAGELQELRQGAGAAAAQPPPMLTDRLRASHKEADALIDHIDAWLSRDEVDLAVRVDGLAWVASSLARARLQNVREKRFIDLLDVLFGALPAELEHHPIDAPTSRQNTMLRQAVFARVEDPKVNSIRKRGRVRMILQQLARSRRFRSGRGIAPRIGASWPDDVRMESIASIRAAASADEAGAIDELMTRYLRASVLGGRWWGAGYYGWPMVAGLQALLLNVACAGWLSRLHAAGRESRTLQIVDVRAALGRLDRTAGRARWLGSRVERLRLAYLDRDDGLRRLLREWAMVNGQ